MTAPHRNAPKGRHAALLFAMVAERLTAYYEHGAWLKDAQAVAQARDWLARDRNQKAGLPEATLRRLAEASDEMARQIAAALSREAGLSTAHHMMEALDPNHGSELADTLMAQCADRVADLALADE